MVQLEQRQPGIITALASILELGYKSPGLGSGIGEAAGGKGDGEGEDTRAQSGREWLVSSTAPSGSCSKKTGLAGTCEGRGKR